MYFKLFIIKFSKSFYNILYGFHMVLTRSSAKTENMATSEEIRNYFSDLIKPFTINQSLKEMFSKLKEEIMSKFEEKLEQQMNQKGNRRSKQIGLTSLKGKLLCRKRCQIYWKLNVITMNNTADVLVFGFIERKYRRMNLLIM